MFTRSASVSDRRVLAHLRIRVRRIATPNTRHRVLKIDCRLKLTMTENGILDLKDVGDWTRQLRRRRLNDVVGVNPDPASMMTLEASV